MKTIKHVKVSASGGVSVPAWAIVQSKGFKKNLIIAKRIADKMKGLPQQLTNR